MNLDFARAQFVVRDGKGGKDRITMLPAVALPGLQAQLEMTQRQYSLDRAADAAMQRAMKQAVVAAGIAKRATCHTLRDCFATRLLESGTDII